VSPVLAGTGRVADDLWLLAHDDVTGRAFVQPRPLGLGLAAGLLAELVLTGSLSLAGEQFRVTAGRWPPADDLAARVLGLVAGEREQHPVRDWLAYLARTAPEDVAARLAACGYLARAGGWVPWRGGRWVPADRDSAFAPLLRARAVLDAGRPLTAEGVVLAGLGEACGLGFRLAAYAPKPARPLDAAVALLDLGLRDLIACTKAAVSSAVLAHRA